MNLIKHRITAKIHMGNIYMGIIAAMIGYKLIQL